MISSAKKQEYLKKKFYHNEHPKLNKIIHDVVDEYKQFDKTFEKIKEFDKTLEKIKTDWMDSEEFKASEEYKEYIETWKDFKASQEYKKYIETSKKFKADWGDSKEYEKHFNFSSLDISKQRPGFTKIYHGSVYGLDDNGNIKGINKQTDFFPNLDINWFSLSERSSQLHSIDKAYNRTVIKTIRNSYDEEEEEEEEEKEEENYGKFYIEGVINNKTYKGFLSLKIPIVFVYEIDNDFLNSLSKLDISYWENSEFLPFGFDDMVIAKRICEMNNEPGYRFEEDQNQIMICKNTLNSLKQRNLIKLINVEFLNPKQWRKQASSRIINITPKITPDIDETMKNVYLAYKEKYGEIFEDFEKEIVERKEDFIKMLEMIRQTTKSETSFSLYRPIKMNSEWFHDDLAKRLNLYLDEDATNDNWDVKVEPFEVFNWVYFISEEDIKNIKKLKIKTGEFKMEPYERVSELNPKITNMTKKDVINNLTLFEGITVTQQNALYDKVSNILKRSHIGAMIEENFKDYLKLEILDIVRPSVLDTIQHLANLLKYLAYVIISGGEAVNLSLPIEFREPTGDIDTKIVIKSEENKALSYIKYMNNMWYNYLDEIVDKLNKNYQTKIYNEFIKVLNPSSKDYKIELKILNFSLYNNMYEKQQVFTKRYTRQFTPIDQFGEDNILFAIDMKIKSFINFDNKEFNFRDTVYGGFLDIPLIYNPNNRKHLLDKIFEYNKSIDYGKLPTFNKLKDTIVDIKGKVEKRMEKQRQKMKESLIKREPGDENVYFISPQFTEDENVYFISPQFTEDDIKYLLRLKLRPHKEEKDRNRLKVIKNKRQQIASRKLTSLTNQNIPLRQQYYKHEVNDCNKMTCYGLIRILYFTVMIKEKEELDEQINIWYDSGVKLPFDINRELLNKSYKLEAFDTYKKMIKNNFFQRMFEDRHYWVNVEDENCLLKDSQKKDNFTREDYREDCYDLTKCMEYNNCNYLSSNYEIVLNMNYIRNSNMIEEDSFTKNHLVPFLCILLKNRLIELKKHVDKREYKKACGYLIDEMLYDNFKYSYDLPEDYNVAIFNEFFSYYLIYLEGIQRFKFISEIRDIIDIVNNIVRTYSADYTWF